MFSLIVSENWLPEAQFLKNNIEICQQITANSFVWGFTVKFKLTLKSVEK